MKIITTNYKSQDFWKQEELDSIEVGCMNVINIYTECKRQVMKGFGGAFTESAGYNYHKLSEESQKEFIEAYFSKQGLNYNVGRTHINSCDFSLSNYSAVEDPDDTEFTTFHLHREEKYILPLMEDAIKICNENIEILLSPWSPPAFMKTNGEMNNGGELKQDYYEAWAKYIFKYIKEMQKKKIDIQYVSVQNEPDATQTWDSCRYSAEQEMKFVRDHLGPILEKNNLSNVKILIWDHNKEIVFERANAIFTDKVAEKYIYGIGVHWYTGDHFEGLGLVKDKYPSKEIFFTEGCVEYSRFIDSNEIGKAEMYAHDMIGNFKNGVSAFFDWNLLLDSKGGPNHVHNYCASPIMCTPDEKNIEKRLSYYYIGHFSRYIKKGARVIATTTYSSDVECCGFENPDGEIVLVVLNNKEKELPITIRYDGEGQNLVLKPHTITTICYERKIKK